MSEALSGLGITIILVSLNVPRSVPSFILLWKNVCLFGIFCPLQVARTHQKTVELEFSREELNYEIDFFNDYKTIQIF